LKLRNIPPANKYTHLSAISYLEKFNLLAISNSYSVSLVDPISLEKLIEKQIRGDKAPTVFEFQGHILVYHHGGNQLTAFSRDMKRKTTLQFHGNDVTAQGALV
jgi:hypothetical protein